MPPTPAYPMDIGTNFWDGNPQVFRGFKVAPTGSPLNVSKSVAADCGIAYETPPCTSSPSGDPNPSDESWFTIDSSSVTLKTAFWNASAMLLSDTNSDDIRRTKARNEVWAASIMDSASTYLPLAQNDLNTVLSNGATSPALKSSLWMLKGTVHEMLGQPDSAALCYATVAATYHQYSDSLYANWGVQREALPADTTPQYDSLRRVYNLRVHTDLIAMLDTIYPPAKPAFPATAGQDDLPALRSVTEGAGALRVSYYVPSESTVAIDVFDILGAKRSGLLNAVESEGTHNVESSVQELPEGTYIVRMEALGRVLSRKLIIHH